MKKFKLKTSPLVLTLTIIAVVIFAISTALNIYGGITSPAENKTARIISILLSAVSLTSLVFTVAAVVYSRYVITEKFLYCRFGLIFIKTDVRKIVQLTEFKAQNTLVMYLNNEKYAIVLIKDKYFQDFYKTLKAVNPEIIYTVQSADE